MFSTRFIATALLVFYGIPMVAGPHWHHHHHDGCQEAACAESEASDESRCNCACHREHPSDDAPPGDGARVNLSAIQASHAACAICDFYACAQFSDAEIYTASSAPLQDRVAIATVSDGYALRCTPQARGPPAA